MLCFENCKARYCAFDLVKRCVHLVSHGCCDVAQHRGFKSYKQIVKLYYKLGAREDMLQAYRWLPRLFTRPGCKITGLRQMTIALSPRKEARMDARTYPWPSPQRGKHPTVCNLCSETRREMLTYGQMAVTRNQSEQKINSLLDTVSNSADSELLQARASHIQSGYIFYLHIVWIHFVHTYSIDTCYTYIKYICIQDGCMLDLHAVHASKYISHLHEVHAYRIPLHSGYAVHLKISLLTLHIRSYSSYRTVSSGIFHIFTVRA
jgi:hypothetical protein